MDRRGWTDERVDGRERTDGRMDGTWMNGRMNGRTGRGRTWTDGRKDGRTDETWPVVDGWTDGRIDERTERGRIWTDVDGRTDGQTKRVRTDGRRDGL